MGLPRSLKVDCVLVIHKRRMIEARPSGLSSVRRLLRERRQRCELTATAPQQLRIDKTPSTSLSSSPRSTTIPPVPLRLSLSLPTTRL